MKVLSNLRFLFLCPWLLKNREEDGDRVRGGEYGGHGPESWAPG